MTFNAANLNSIGHYVGGLIDQDLRRSTARTESGRYDEIVLNVVLCVRIRLSKSLTALIVAPLTDPQTPAAPNLFTVFLTSASLSFSFALCALSHHFYWGLLVHAASTTLLFDLVIDPRRHRVSAGGTLISLRFSGTD